MNDRELLAATHPSKKSAYSPNLHRFAKVWMRRGGHTMPEVWRSNAHGNLWIGTMYLDQWDCPFVGCSLAAVLRNGASENKNRGAYIGFGTHNMTKVADFWDVYLNIGRCMIDVDHTINFINSGDGRYSMDSDIRTCQWCGAKHQRTIETKIIEEQVERFSPIPA